MDNIPNTTQPNIPQVTVGTLVDYIRHHASEGVLQGKGYVKAYGLDPENRIIALVQDKKRRDPATGKPQVFNVPARGVNPTPEFVEALHALVQNAETLTAEANAAIRKLTEEANEKLRVMNNEVLGAPLDLPEGVDEDAETQEAERPHVTTTEKRAKPRGNRE